MIELSLNIMFFFQCLNIGEDVEAKYNFENTDLETHPTSNDDDEPEKEVEKSKIEVTETASSIEKEVSKIVPEKILKRKLDESDQPTSKRQRTLL